MFSPRNPMCFQQLILPVQECYHVQPATCLSFGMDDIWVCTILCWEDHLVHFGMSHRIPGSTPRCHCPPTAGPSQGADSLEVHGTETTAAFVLAEAGRVCQDRDCVLRGDSREYVAVLSRVLT